MDKPTSVPLHLTSLAILAPNNSPLYIHAFTGKDDELRAYHLAHAAVDVIEERKELQHNLSLGSFIVYRSHSVVMAASTNRPADCYLGLLFCMEDMAFYGFQTHTKLRLVVSIALVDAAIKDSDVVAVFRAVHQLLLQAVNNPFLSLPASFMAKPASKEVEKVDNEEPVKDAKKDKRKDKSKTDDLVAATQSVSLDLDAPRNEPIPEKEMFATGPDDIRPEWLTGNKKFTSGVDKLGELLCARS